MKHLVKELMVIIVFTNYNYFCNISFSCSLPYEINIMNFFNTGPIFGSEVLTICKKYGVEGPVP